MDILSSNLVVLFYIVLETSDSLGLGLVLEHLLGWHFSQQGLVNLQYKATVRN